MHDNVLVSDEQLEQIVCGLAEEVSSAYENTDSLLALVLLEGAKYFANDLLSKTDLPFDVEYLKVSSYFGTASTGTVTLEGHDDLPAKVRNKNILVIDDIYDTGHTLSKLLAWLKQCEPQSIKTCVLLEKRIDHDKQVVIDFLGTTIEDVFVIGYGMDYDDQYRELPFIAELSSELIEE